MNTTKIILVALGAMVILFNMPLIIGFFMAVFFFIIKLAWNLLWIIAIVGIALAFFMKHRR